jgi:hypothetical protein
MDWRVRSLYEVEYEDGAALVSFMERSDRLLYDPSDQATRDT